MLQKHLPHIEISLDNLIHNCNEIRKRLLPSNEIIAMVKDNAYGCGAVIISQTLEQEGVGFFAVTHMGEARELRQNSVHSPILVLGECSHDDLPWASQHNVRITVNSIETLTALAQLNQKVMLHINIDTGMSRMGLSPHEVTAAAEIITAHETCELEGVFTHFAGANEPGTDTVNLQQNLFTDALQILKKQGLSPTIIHLSNSAALLRYPVPEHYSVRPGIALYGCKPDPQQDVSVLLLPIAALKAPVVKIKKAARGTAVSYGGTHILKRDSHIATVPIGYAHGYPRLLSNTGEVLIRGKRFPVLGRVTMDYIMVDLGPKTDITVGDEVTAMGSQGNEVISPDDIALLSNTIGYEILSNLSHRIDRFYYRNGKIIAHQRALPA